MKTFSVYPRYSAGSPALVDSQTAHTVARQERWGHTRCLEGIYGNEAKAKAEKLGLRGIVEQHEARARHINFTDLLTGDTGVIINNQRTYGEVQRLEMIIQENEAELDRYQRGLRRGQYKPVPGETLESVLKSIENFLGSSNRTYHMDRIDADVVVSALAELQRTRAPSL